MAQALLPLSTESCCLLGETKKQPTARNNKISVGRGNGIGSSATFDIE
jgi:hypothetical protein